MSDPTAFGVAELARDGRVIRLEEKPEVPRRDLAVIGVYLFTSAVHTAVAAIEPSSRGELEITDAVQWLIDAGNHVRADTIDGYWKDTGNAADMLDVNHRVLADIEPAVLGTVDDTSVVLGRVRIEPGARIIRSRIVGPAVIGAGTTVVDACVGPSTSASEGCVISGSDVEFSIILKDAHIAGAGRIVGSLIGRSVHITGAAGTPPAHRFVLGDHSRIQLAS
ncbi:sugar phosphate nucleotidyltransferase [Streptomyces lydicus]|uniref:sugar phosphate nucleotidyltransferase n=1 Tax=Streptomyces lydicus TaxID=47763 RepID=UPI0032208FFF